jgi:hypothetical protein
MVRHPRFELGPSAWKADILAIILMPHFWKKHFTPSSPRETKLSIVKI